MNTLHLHWDQPRLGRLDGRYRLVEPLGRGGTSEVWRGLDERLGRPVAVKILQGREEHWIRNEAQALALLAHPHIAAVYDYGYSHRRHYIVMELVRGEPLAAALDRGPLHWSTAVRSCAQVASALAAAHARGVVHRDVTPGNIMLTAAGVKLIDFGISAVAGDREADAGGDLYGTPPYAAPERLRNEAVAPAVDVFALGVVLYRALSGSLPWQAHTAEQLMAAQQRTDPTDLPPVDGLPDDVGDACMECLAHDPADRPSAAELADLLSATSTGDLAGAVVVGAEPVVQPPTEALVGGLVTGSPALTRVLPGVRGTLSPVPDGRNSRRVRQGAAALALSGVAALAWFATGVGPSDRPVPLEAGPAATAGGSTVRPPAATSAPDPAGPRSTRGKQVTPAHVAPGSAPRPKAGAHPTPPRAAQPNAPQDENQDQDRN